MYIKTFYIDSAKIIYLEIYIKKKINLIARMAVWNVTIAYDIETSASIMPLKLATVSYLTTSRLAYKQLPEITD